MSMTISQLKQELTNHGVPLPSAARKEVYERLYQEHVVNAAKRKSKAQNDFSSDEETGTNGNGAGYANGKEDDEEEELDPTITEAVEQLTNDEIYKALLELGKAITPVVDSTRVLYKKRLIKLWSQNSHFDSEQGSAADADELVNGHGDNGIDNAQHFSSDEELDTSEPSSSKEAPRLTEAEKDKLNALLYPSPGSSKSKEVPSTSEKKVVQEQKGGGYSIKTLIIGSLVALLAIYLAYEYFEEVGGAQKEIESE